MEAVMIRRLEQGWQRSRSEARFASCLRERVSGSAFVRGLDRGSGNREVGAWREKSGEMCRGRGGLVRNVAGK
jgi:hypothetical protein